MWCHSPYACKIYHHREGEQLRTNVAFEQNSNEQWEDEYKILNNTSVDIRHLGSLSAVWERQKQIQEELSKEKWMPECILCDSDFICAVTEYLKTNITSALNSDNYILRVFAYMDRRVGKRTLIKIKEDAEALPEWVKQFYLIRCEAEGL